MVAVGGSGNHKPLNEKERRRKPGRNEEGKAPTPTLKEVWYSPSSSQQFCGSQ